MPVSIVSDEYVKDRIGAFPISTSQYNVRLFTNNYTPDRADDLTHYTQGAWNTYAAVHWTITPITVGPDHKAKFIDLVCEFFAPTSGGNATVYGFYVTYQRDFDATERIMMASRFPDAPKTLVQGGPSFLFNVFFKLFDLTLLP